MPTWGFLSHSLLLSGRTLIRTHRELNLLFGRAAVEDKAAVVLKPLYGVCCAFFRLGFVCAKAERSRILNKLVFRLRSLTTTPCFRTSLAVPW